MSTQQQLSKRSRRLLSEAARHLLFAGRSIKAVSIDVYHRLQIACNDESGGPMLEVGLQDIDSLRAAIYRCLGEEV